MELKFSIITVCYNEEKKIQSTIESVLNQGWKNYEHIIIDGKSEDLTMEIVQRYGERDKRIWWQSEEDNGIYNAMNKGISYTEGDFLCFLNAGDILYNDKVLETVAARIEETNADIVYGDRIRTDSGQMNSSSYPIGANLPNYLKSRKNICHQVIFASKESLKDGFDEQFKICADYDWLCHQVIMERKTAKVDTIIVDFDAHGVTSQARYQKIGLQESLKVVRKYFPEMRIWYYGEVENLILQNIKNRMLYRCMNKWLVLKQRNVKISSFFIDRKLNTIAIYGFHHMGQRLYDELKDSPVKVAYVIDKNDSIAFSDLPVVQREAKLEVVDAIIVTPICDFLEIKEDLAKRVKCKIISMEDVLFLE